MFFSFITKNSNWEILTKHLITFKRQDGGLRTKDLNIFWGLLKNQLLGGGFTKNQHDCLKKGSWTFCRFKRRVVKKHGVVFLRGLIPQCTL